MQMDQSLYVNILVIWILVGILVLPLTLFVTAPFGRHFNSKYGPTVGNRLGWIVMESPAIWLFTIVFIWSAPNWNPASHNYVAWILWSLWMLHYVNRGLVFPFRIRTSGKQIPILIVLFALCFQLVNGYLNGMALGHFGSKYSGEWLKQPAFWTGFVIFALGWLINVSSDEELLHLRNPGGSGYSIPRGGLFEWVSCPNFLGEIILWIGWALMCWNLAALSFAIWTMANLIPRALAHHRWYQTNFPEYPSKRKAVIPGLL